MEQLNLSCGTYITADVKADIDLVRFEVRREYPGDDLLADTTPVGDLEAQMFVKQVTQLRDWLDDVIKEATDAREELLKQYADEKCLLDRR